MRAGRKLPIGIALLLAAGAANRLFLGNAAQLTLGDVPALAAHSAENAALCHLLAEAPQKLILCFIWAQGHCCHAICHLLSELK